MSDHLSNELESRSLELAKLSAMDPDDRIARIVWERVQDELEKQDSMEYGMQFCISNIAKFIEKNFRETDYTRSAIAECHALTAKLGWNLEKVMQTDQSEKNFHPAHQRGCIPIHRYKTKSLRERTMHPGDEFELHALARSLLFDQKKF